MTFLKRRKRMPRKGLYFRISAILVGKVARAVFGMPDVHADFGPIYANVPDDDDD